MFNEDIEILKKLKKDIDDITIIYLFIMIIFFISAYMSGASVGNILLAAILIIIFLYAIRWTNKIIGQRK